MPRTIPRFEITDFDELIEAQERQSDEIMRAMQGVREETRLRGLGEGQIYINDEPENHAYIFNPTLPTLEFETAKKPKKKSKAVYDKNGRLMSNEKEPDILRGVYYDTTIRQER